MKSLWWEILVGITDMSIFHFEIGSISNR